jgi:hypothetical protein
MINAIERSAILTDKASILIADKYEDQFNVFFIKAISWLISLQVNECGEKGSVNNNHFTLFHHPPIYKQGIYIDSLFQLTSIDFYLSYILIEVAEC